MDQMFYVCPVCGKIIAVVKDSPVPVMCCGKKMEQLKANTQEAATEKHIPVYTVEGNIVNVTVGSVEHPMTEAHLIEWISVQTKQGNQRKVLKADQPPKASFAICPDDEVVAVFAYCNLHGLWKG